MPCETKNSNPSWFGFPITIKNNSKIKRYDLLEYLDSHNIGTRLLFGGNIIKQPYMYEKEYRVVGQLNVSNRIMKDSFWLGIYPGVGKKELSYLSKVLHKYCNKMLN